MARELSSLKGKNILLFDSDNSGGSDDETETCSDLNLSFEKLGFGPKKKLLVLSLLGLLVHRVHKKSHDKCLIRQQRPDFTIGNYYIYKRPHCDEFMKFCFETFDVGLWSSALERNIDGVIKAVMGDFRSKLLFVWNQEECTDSGFLCLDNDRKPLFLKELKYLWENMYSSLPWKLGKYSSSNTLLIDNDPYKALLNPPNTAVFPEPYDPNNKDDNFLGAKGEFRAFLEGVADAEDVASYVKEHSFGQPAITASHPDWRFYSKIRRRFGVVGGADEKK